MTIASGSLLVASHTCVFGPASRSSVAPGPPILVATHPGSTAFDRTSGHFRATDVDEIVRAKPSASKGRYINKITLTSTMGPGIHVDPARTRGIVEELEESAEPATV